MSRTTAHVPERVENARGNHTEVEHRHWAAGIGPITCGLAGGTSPCSLQVASWASSQPHTRTGVAVLERRAAVRDELRLAGKQYRATRQVGTDVLIDPVRHCLCQSCGHPFHD